MFMATEHLEEDYSWITSRFIHFLERVMKEERSFHILHVTASQHGQNVPSKGCVMVTIKGNHPFK